MSQEKDKNCAKEYKNCEWKNIVAQLKKIC